MCYFQERQLLVVKQFCCKLILLHYPTIYMSSKSLSQILKILFQAGDINIFVLRGVFFNSYVRLKSSFTDEKNISDEIRDTL